MDHRPKGKTKKIINFLKYHIGGKLKDYDMVMTF